MFEGSDLPDIGGLIYALLIASAVGSVFTIWKLIDVAVWLFNHIRIV